MFEFIKKNIKELVKKYRKRSEHVKANAEPNSTEQSMIKNLLSFKDSKVGEVMIPRTDLIGIDSHADFNTIKGQFINTGYTRVPVYKENLDDIIGFLHIKDFIQYMDGSKTFKLSEVMRNIIYSPRSAKCIDLLAHMRSSTTHIAVILDEYGGTEGMITIEKLVEQIIGDIRDEHDKEIKVFITQVSDKNYIVDARASIQDLEEILQMSLSQEDGEYETFGGFILSYLDRIPTKGEKIIHPMGLEIEIIDADQRKIKSTKVKIKNADA